MVILLAEPGPDFVTTRSADGVFFWRQRLDGTLVPVLRRIFNILSAGSLVLCVGYVAILWMTELTPGPILWFFVTSVALTAILPALWLSLWWRRWSHRVRIFTILAAVSGVLCVVLVGLCLMSYLSPWRSGSPSRGYHFYDGVLQLSRIGDALKRYCQILCMSG